MTVRDPMQREEVEIEAGRIINQTGVVRPWKAREDAFLREHAFWDVAELAAALDRTAGAITTRGKRLNLKLARHCVDRDARAAYVRSKLRERVLRHVEYDTNGGCWLWSGNAHAFGYGRLTLQNEPLAAHRASWTAFRGPIADGLIVCHRCDVPACVNPTHLFLGTHADNTRDMMAKGRGARRAGEQNTQARLTADDVIDIRRRIGRRERQCDIARLYGVTQPTISDIKHRRSWAHVMS